MVTIDGGVGDDAAQVVSTRGGTIAMVDGEDELLLSVTSFYGLTSVAMGFGDGRDTLALEDYFGAAYIPQLTMSDFAAGDGGDVFDLSGYVGTVPTNYNGGDPFRDQHLRLIQNGNGTIVQIDIDGKQHAYDWQTLTTFSNTDATAFTAENFGGYNPVVASDSTALDWRSHDLNVSIESLALA